jgi:hypothetical protein
MDAEVVTDHGRAPARRYTVSIGPGGSATLSGAGTGTPTSGSPVTFTASSTSLTVTVSGSPAWVQVEAGAFASSPITTAGASATRALDNITFGATPLAAVNATAGTLIVEADHCRGGVNQSGAFQLFGDNFLMYTSSPAALTSSSNGGANFITASAPTGSDWHSGVRRGGLAWDAAGRSLCDAGGSITTDANAKVSMAAAHIGTNAGAANPLFGLVRSFGIWPVRLADLDLVAAVR